MNYLIIFSLLFLLVSNTITFHLFLKYRKNLHIAQGKINVKGSIIKEIRLTDLDPAFRISEFGYDTSSEACVILKGDVKVDGGTNDLETWVLSVLSKYSTFMFEFGTCTGKTSYLWAKNSSKESKVVTLTLPPDKVGDYKHTEGDSNLAYQTAIKESKLGRFLYSGTGVENKITQLFMDSKSLNENEYINAFDLIFVDGSHAYSYIKSDTEKVFIMLKANGILLWHDYNMTDPGTRDVYRYLNELNNTLPLFHIRGTSLVGYRKMA